MKLKIKVTKEILRKSAMCGNNNKVYKQNCAIALALKSIFDKVDVGPKSFRVLQCEVIYFPNEAIDFIEQFDRLRDRPHLRIEMSEIEFEVALTNAIISKINIDEAREALKNSTTLELIEG